MHHQTKDQSKARQDRKYHVMMNLPFIQLLSLKATLDIYESKSCLITAIFRKLKCGMWLHKSLNYYSTYLNQFSDFTECGKY
ncbi:hypothetical protein MKW98_006765 [Papaver atlanticum]|uniref:Uncharacterized protein n=1 Tax=Papaver atlanticum TaxID=357466 RepID=A0AAD4T2S1_9MAGN|nr:hypothetical protein MKW98_006765 [Papaver atlanticum]